MRKMEGVIEREGEREGQLERGGTVGERGREREGQWEREKKGESSPASYV